MRSVLLVLIMLIAPALGGCSADQPMNPSFPLRLGEARDELRVMHEQRKPLPRPVVILGGIHDPGVVGPTLVREIRDIATDDVQVISVSFFWASDFDACRRKVIDAVDEAFGIEAHDRTVEVDVIAVSMGGLVARYAAREHETHARRLDVRRLFSIATPHRGARMATLPTLDQRIVDMRAGSSFLQFLNEPVPGDPEIYPYTRLGDAIVGPDRTAPPGRHPWWVQNAPFSFAHLMASHDARFLADIARRLRGETPYTTEPAAPLPSAAAAARANTVTVTDTVTDTDAS